MDKARILIDNKFGGIFSEKWLSDNNDIVFADELVSNWSLTEVIPSEDLYDPTFNGTEWVEGLTETEIEDIVSEASIEAEYQKYLQRKKDGVLMFLRLSAELRVAKLSGTISEETHSFTEDTLKPVRNECVLGQWIDAFTILKAIDQTTIIETFYNQIHTTIENYINSNY